MTSASQPDASLLIGMTLSAASEIEPAMDIAAGQGFNAVEVHVSQLSPSRLVVRTTPAHAGAVFDALAERHLQPSTLNATGYADFDPHSGPEAWERSCEAVAHLLRVAAAMHAPRLLLWDGIVSNWAGEESATDVLLACLDEGRIRSGLSDIPEISLELHTFTYVLKHGVLTNFARRIGEAPGIGVCLDFCHFGVALGPKFHESLTEDVLQVVDHIHFADTDCLTSEFHFPPGRGVLDLSLLADLLAGRGLAAAWDLFSWPTPAMAVAQSFDAYRHFVNAINLRVEV